MKEASHKEGWKEGRQEGSFKLCNKLKRNKTIKEK